MSDIFPINKKEMKMQGLKNVDFVLVSGDAYIDHPSFGAAIIARMLERFGYSVAILAQPNYNNAEQFKQFGRPNLAFLVTSGNIESMVNHYTVSKKRRKVDVYTPNGKINRRPDRAVIVYSKLCKEAYSDCPIIIGGIEASLRRLSHYDYWDNTVMKSILIDSNADLLVFGMGEKTIIEVADYLKSGLSINDITFINGTVYKCYNLDNVYDYIELPSFKDVCKSKKLYASSFKIQYENTDSINGLRLVERYNDCYVVQNPSSPPLLEHELDQIYELPYTYDVHPIYKDIGEIKAINEVKFSINVNRGCAAGCNFCALTFHQGRVVQSRSVSSVLNEGKLMTTLPDFKGNINDVGGPTANFLEVMCEKQKTKGVCKSKRCIANDKCSELIVDHNKYNLMLDSLRKLNGVKNVFIRSGVRYDYVMYDTSDEFLNRLVKYHTSGQLRVAPEHIDINTLELMGKPDVSIYNSFVSKFNSKCKQFKKEQYIVPYLMSSHPGCDINAAINLAIYLNNINHQPLQVQDFYPTPGTISTVMYYTKINPLTNKSVYVATTEKEKRVQRALMQFKNPKNYYIVKQALLSENRNDLIGYGKECLIPPRLSNKNKI